MRIAYIAPYQGPVLQKQRPIIVNLSLAGNVKIELVAEALRRSSQDVEILSQGEVVEPTFRLYPGFTEPNSFDPEIPVHYASALPIRRLNGLWSAFRTLQLFRHRHRARPFDAVIIYNLKLPQMVCALYAARYYGLPVTIEYEDDAYVDVRGGQQPGRMAGMYSELTTVVLKDAAGCIGASPHLLSLTSPSIPKVLLRGVISGDILSRSRRPATERKRWVAFSGTFAGSKGLEPLLKAWDMVNLRDWELHIAGGGEKADSLKQMAAHNKSIVFHGVLNRAENAEFLATAMIGINPHDLSETPGNVFAFKIIEYLAAGTHVITTPMGALEPELEAGVTYIPDNSPTTIAAAILRVIEQQEYTRTAVEAVEQTYGPDAIARNLDSLLRRVCAANAARSS